MLSKEALEARRKYQREYYQKNKERFREQKNAYWERVAQRNKAEQEAGENGVHVQEVRE